MLSAAKSASRKRVSRLQPDRARGSRFMAVLRTN
jgi:hypothetical protein